MLEYNRIYNMDCMEGIKLLDDNSIDLVVIDPPYKLDLNKVRKTNTFNNYANELLELKDGFDLMCSGMKSPFSHHFSILFR